MIQRLKTQPDKQTKKSRGKPTPSLKERAARSSNSKAGGSANPLLKPLSRMTGQLKPPNSLFNGLLIANSPSPDNIIIFERTDTAAFRPEGVSNNFHHRYELVCVLEGSGPVRIGDHTYQFESGDVALIFPNQFHHYMDVEAKLLDWLFITFEMTQAGGLQSLLDQPRCMDADSVTMLRDALSPYFDRKTATPDALAIAYHLSQFLKHMSKLPKLPAERCNLKTDSTSRDIVLEQINSYVSIHLSDSPTMADVADALGYSVSHLRAVFRDRLGVSLGRYIRESRLSEAAKLLQDTKLSVTEISERTGFESLYAFSRAFKNTYGISPKLYSQKVGGHPS